MPIDWPATTQQCCCTGRRTSELGVDGGRGQSAWAMEHIDVRGENGFVSVVYSSAGVEVQAAPLGALRAAEGRKNRYIMTPDERERMAILCERIATEKNHDKYTTQVEQLNDLLGDKERRLRKDQCDPLPDRSVIGDFSS
jgi:hypothetical protein